MKVSRTYFNNDIDHSKGESRNIESIQFHCRSLLAIRFKDKVQEELRDALRDLDIPVMPCLLDGSKKDPTAHRLTFDFGSRARTLKNAFGIIAESSSSPADERFLKKVQKHILAHRTL